MKQWLGSMLFTVLLFISVAVYGIIVLVARLFGYELMYRAVCFWCRMIMWLLKTLCGLDYTVSGREHIPDDNCVVLMKHSSSWETIAQLLIFPRQVWVLKRELMWAPILGWVLYFLRPIAINRKGGRVAVQQVLAQGTERLADGLWVVVFPEGTRVPFGQSGRFGLSGTLLAQAAGKPIIPVAHNAGWYWPRRSTLKKRGTIQVMIGPPVRTAGRDAREVNTEVQAWIESGVQALTPDSN